MNINRHHWISQNSLAPKKMPFPVPIGLWWLILDHVFQITFSHIVEKYERARNRVINMSWLEWIDSLLFYF